MIKIRCDDANRLNILEILGPYTSADVAWSVERFNAPDFSVEYDRLSVFRSAADIAITPDDLVALTYGIARSLARRASPARARGAVVVPGEAHPLAAAFPMFTAGDPDARIEQRLFETVEAALDWLERPRDLPWRDLPVIWTNG